MTRLPTVWSLVAACLLAACRADADSGALQRATAAFVMVGAIDDLGYNQAVFEGTLEVARRFPDVEIIRAENVPETEEAERVMRELVEDRGADVVFATSFGHLPFAYAVARDHPDVVFVHQGGTEPDPPLHNFGTYFGSHWEAMFQAGVAAGHASESQVLGFIAAFPIPATYANVDAFTLGAQRVQPSIRTIVRLTQDWCNPEVQRRLATELIAEGADVLGLHQDCTAAILGTAEDAGVKVVGYHADGSEVAVTQWLAGAVWVWGPLYANVIQTVLDGTFGDSPYSGDHRGSIADGDNPFTLTQPGPSVSLSARREMDEVGIELRAGTSPFTGPLTDNRGIDRLGPGETLSVADIDVLDWYVAGVEAP